MCEMCNGKTAAEVLRDESRQIEKKGYAVVLVADPDPAKSFGYTVGLTRIKRPEFLVRGLGTEDSWMALNVLAQSVIDGERYADGHSSTWITPEKALYFKPCKGARRYALGAYTRYGDATRVLEIHVVDRAVLGSHCRVHREELLGLD